MLNTLKKYPEYYFIAKFLLLFLCLYFGTELWIGLCSPDNNYVPLLDKYFNYIKWYRVSILKASATLSNLLGYKAYLANSFKINGYNGYNVIMVFSCIGYGIVSFWVALCLSYPTHLKHKIKWLFLGVFLLWFANVLRVLALLLLINKTKDVNIFSQHHFAYNVATYFIVGLMIYLFMRNKQTQLPTNHPHSKN